MVNPMWPFRRQAEQAQIVLDLLIELHEHCNDLVAGSDLAEAERELRRALKVLRGHEEVPA